MLETAVLNVNDIGCILKQVVINARISVWHLLSSSSCNPGRTRHTPNGTQLNREDQCDCKAAYCGLLEFVSCEESLESLVLRTEVQDQYTPPVV